MGKSIFCWWWKNRRKLKPFLKVTITVKEGMCKTKDIVIYFPQADAKSVHRIFDYDLKATREDHTPYWDTYLRKEQYRADVSGLPTNAADAKKEQYRALAAAGKQVAGEHAAAWAEDPELNAMLANSEANFAMDDGIDPEDDGDDPENPASMVPGFIKRLFAPILEVIEKYTKPKNKIDKLYMAEFCAVGSFDSPKDPDKTVCVYVIPAHLHPKPGCCEKEGGSSLVFDEKDAFCKWTKYTAAGFSSMRQAEKALEEAEKDNADSKKQEKQDNADKEKQEKQKMKKKQENADKAGMMKSYWRAVAKKKVRKAYKLALRFASNAAQGGFDVGVGDLLCSLFEIDLSSISLPGMPELDQIPGFDFLGLSLSVCETICAADGMEFNEEEQDRKEKEELDENKPEEGEEPEEEEQPEDDEKENKEKEKPEDHVGNLVQAQAEEKALEELEQGDRVKVQIDTEGYEPKGWWCWEKCAPRESRNELPNLLQSRNALTRSTPAEGELKTVDNKDVILWVEIT